MTFIIALQLKDSIVVTADKKVVVISEGKIDSFNECHTLKLHTWDNGIIIGTGESYVIHRSIVLFKQLGYSNIQKLPQCLEISKQIRELEIGKITIRSRIPNFFVVAIVKMELNFIR